MFDGYELAGGFLIGTTSQVSRDLITVHRWFYPAMALTFAATAVIGFAPNSLAIIAGTKENPPLLVHLHVAAMTTWLILLVTQATLVAGRRPQIHRILGPVSFFLAPIIVVIMIALVISTFRSDFHPAAIGLIQVRRIILFSLFYLLAMASRKSKPDTHKRMLFLATLVLLDAAILRMPWLPNFGIDNVAITHAYQLLLFVPFIVHDVFRLGHIHKANLLGLVLFLATSVAASALW
jgi:hypothetical protein